MESLHQFENHSNIWRYTKGTELGGGGSPKNTKPIGEIGCCESRMTERTNRWIERWLGPRAVNLHLHISACFSTFASVYPIYLSLELSSYRSIDLSIYLSVYLSIYLSIYPAIHPSIFASIYLSIHVSI